MNILTDFLRKVSTTISQSILREYCYFVAPHILKSICNTAIQVIKPVTLSEPRTFFIAQMNLLMKSWRPA